MLTMMTIIVVLTTIKLRCHPDMVKFKVNILNEYTLILFMLLKLWSYIADEWIDQLINIFLSLYIFVYLGETETGRSYQNFRYLQNKVWINRYFSQFESTRRNEDEGFHSALSTTSDIQWRWILWSKNKCSFLFYFHFIS